MTKPESLQLEVLPFEIDGSTYPLRCNMNVLEKLQNGPGKGEIGNLFQLPSYQAVFEIFLAMVEDACETDPDLPVPDPKRLKRMFSPAQLARAGLFGMFTRSIDPNLPEGPAPVSERNLTADEPDTSGN